MPRKLQPQVYESQFDTEGSFQRIYAQQHMYAILVALVITFVVVAFSQVGASASMAPSRDRVASPPPP